MKPSVVLMGSKPGSVVALQIMLERGWDVQFVVTTPEIKHDWIKGPTLTEEATRLGLKVINQEQLPSDLKVDFVISYMYRKLVKKQTIDMAIRGAMNFHAGPLPEFGGWAFYNIAILENSPEYGCTCHFMDEGFDTGPLMKVRRFPIQAKEHTALSLEKSAQLEMMKLFVDFVSLAEKPGPLPNTPQDKTKMRYLGKKDFMALKKIPANADAETIDRYARAFWYPPYDIAYIELNHHRVEVIPQIAKEKCASFFQTDSYEELKKISKEYKSKV